MNMKTYKAITRTLGIAVLLVGASCSDILELTPQTALSDATAYSTPERIELVIAGMYDAAQSGFYAGGQVRGYPFGAAHIEQGDARGEDVVNTQAFYQVTYQSNNDPTSANNDFHFQTLFGLINRANVTFEGLSKAVPTTGLTQAQIDNYKGECTFLRALAYHELVKMFCRPYSDNPTAANGGMPYKTTPVSGASSANESVVQPRGTVQEDYDKIIADLDYAETNLPVTRSANRLTRANKSAAIALKTRVYLHMGAWAKVVTEGNKLAPQSAAPFSSSANGVYSLTASPYGPFGSGNKSNSESIFSIENDLTDNPGVNGSLPQVFNTSASPTTGRALVAISPLLWNQPWFNATDIRKSSTFVNIDVEATTAGGKGGYFTKKYTDVTGQSDNAPVLRYAEVLLNMAEAIQRQSAAVDARAFALYNAIRSRANAAGTDASYDQASDFATGTAMIQAILNERRIEFSCEGLRWGDIHRLAQDATFNTWGGGIPQKIGNNVSNLKLLYNSPANVTAALKEPAFPYSSFKFVWPIPSSETILNPTLAAQQNPGY